MVTREVPGNALRFRRAKHASYARPCGIRGEDYTPENGQVRLECRATSEQVLGFRPGDRRPVCHRRLLPTLSEDGARQTDSEQQYPNSPSVHASPLCTVRPTSGSCRYVSWTEVNQR